MDPRVPTRSEQAETISQEIASIHWDSYEYALPSVQTMIEDGYVAAVLRFELLPAEELVIAAGDGGSVLRLHHESELELETALRAAVERATGRMVLSFETQTNVEQGLALELFVLAPGRSAVVQGLQQLDVG